MRHRSVFANLNGAEIETLNKNKSCTLYKKGQALFHMNTRPLGVFCVNSGTIKVYRVGVDGKEQIIKVSAGGDLLGYKALLSSQQYEHTAVALEDCVVCFIPKEEFLKLLQPESQFYMTLLKAVCEEHSQITNRMTQMAQMSVRQRLALTLLMLKDTYGIEQKQQGEIEINLSREDLSNIVGTATESLIRLLNQFKKEGLISSKGRKIKILNESGLAKASTH
jgi:CRP/FNR family transcriptional regulator